MTMGKSLIITTGGGTDVEEGGPNATEEQVLSGYTFFATMDDPIVGTMPDHSKLENLDLNPSEENMIELGYHSGEQVISGVSLKFQTEATAKDNEVLVNASGWRDGLQLLGTMANNGAKSNSLSANGTYTVPVGWYNGSGKVTQSLSTQAATNVTPGTTKKTVIAASKWSSGNQIVLGNANLIAGNIKKNITIFGIKGTYAVDVAAYYNQNPVWILNGTTYAPQAHVSTRYWTNTGTWLGFLIFKFMWNSTPRLVTRVRVRIKLNHNIVISDHTRYPTYFDQGWQLRGDANLQSIIRSGNERQVTQGYVIHDTQPNYRGYGFSDDFWLSSYQSSLNMVSSSDNYIIYWWQ